jgi:hypothetical protein
MTGARISASFGMAWLAMNSRSRASVSAARRRTARRRLAGAADRGRHHADSDAESNAEKAEPGTVSARCEEARDDLLARESQESGDELDR